MRKQIPASQHHPQGPNPRMRSCRTSCAIVVGIKKEKRCHFPGRTARRTVCKPLKSRLRRPKILSRSWGGVYLARVPLCLGTIGYFASAQDLIVPSLAPAKAAWPSGEKQTQNTSIECPIKVVRSRHVATSQTLAVLSVLPESRTFPSGENETEVTGSLCAFKVIASFLSAGCHTLTDPSR